MTDPIARLRTAGVSVWLDDLSRERLTTGSLATLRDLGVSGVTTNPTIFARAISDSDDYDAQIQDLKLRRAPANQALRELTASDVRQACDVLRPVYDATGGLDGRVSIEVDPRIAHGASSEMFIAEQQLIAAAVGLAGPRRGSCTCAPPGAPGRSFTLRGRPSRSAAARCCGPQAETMSR